MTENYKKCECIGCDFRMAVFESLSEKDINIICETKTEKTFNKGEIIIEEGRHIGEFIYLKEGLIKIFKKGREGKDQIINIAGPLEFVSLLSVFSEEKYNYSIAALERTTVCIINLELIKNLIASNGNFALSIMQRMSKNADRIIIDNMNINKKNLRGRIAYILIFFADKIYHRISFDLPVSRKEIGQIIGMTTENVIRIFSEFRKDGIIKINGKNIEIADKKRLQSVSDHG